MKYFYTFVAVLFISMSGASHAYALTQTCQPNTQTANPCNDANPPSATISTSPTTTSTGQSYVVSWSSSSATSCSESYSGPNGGGSLGSSLSGSTSLATATAGTYTFTITCTGSGATVSASDTHTVVTCGWVTDSTDNQNGCTQQSPYWSPSAPPATCDATISGNTYSYHTSCYTQMKTCSCNNPAPTNDAVCTSMSAPTAVQPGQSFSASVTVNNTGGTTWTPSGTNNYSLGSQSPQDNSTWGTGRVLVPSSVSPGGSATFTKTFTAPTTPGTYTFAWKMVQEYVEWFGTTCSQSITVSGSAPTASLSASPASVSPNGQSTLTWGSTNATSCSAGGPWSNSGSLSGSGLTNPLTGDTTFTFQCSTAATTPSPSSNSATITTSAVASAIFVDGHLDKSVYAPGDPINLVVHMISDDNPQGVTPIAYGTVPGQSQSADVFPGTYTPQQLRDGISGTIQIGTAPTSAGSYSVTTYYSSGGYTNSSGSLAFTVSTSGSTLYSNIASATVHVAQPSSPDLIISVDAAPSPSSPVAGSAATLSATVQNQGSGAVSGTYNNVIQVDADTDHTAVTATLAATSLSNTAAGGTGSISTSYTFASAQTYYIRACADENTSMVGSVSEANEGNNCGNWIPVTVGSAPPPNTVDLIISVDAASSPASPVAGTAATLSATVKNQGSVAVSGTYNNVIQVDADTDHTAVTATLAATSLSNTAAGGTGSISTNYTFASAQTYYIRACADENTSMVGSVSESNEGNNCGNWIPVTTAGAPSTDCVGTTVNNCVLPDATNGTSVDGSCAAGYTGACNYACNNTAWSQNTNTCVSSTAPTGTISASACTIAVGASSCTTTVTWSTANVTSAKVTKDGASFSTLLNGSKDTSVGGGTASAFVLIDNSTGTTLASRNRKGTCASGSGWNGTYCELGYLPDLTAGDVTPTTAQTGSVTLQATISNIGPLTTSRNFNNFFQVAPNPDGTGFSDIGSVSMNTLAAGASNTSSKSYNFNTQGTYYVRACADKRNSSDAGQIDEANEGNNCSPDWSAITITGPVPTATLTASPTSINPGQTSKLTWSSTNATSCQFADQGTSVGTSGSRNVSPSATSDYSVTCSGGGNTSSPAFATVTVLTPNLSLTATPSRVQKGNTSTVAWNAANIKSCTITRNGVAWKNGSPPSHIYTGSSVDTISVQTTYVMTCTDVNGANPVKTTLVVNIAPAYQEF